MASICDLLEPNVRRVWMYIHHACVDCMNKFPEVDNFLYNLCDIPAGYYTGSIYSEPALYKYFKGEMTADVSTIAIKTHSPANEEKYRGYRRAVVIIREPGEAVMAETNRLKINHTARLDEERIKSKC